MVFTGDACKQNHAFMYALECHERRHITKIILEGPATACLNRLADGGKFAELFRRAGTAGLLEGICKTASGGCSTNKKDRDVAKLAEKEGLKFMCDLNGHAGIGKFVDEGYEVIIF